MRGRPFRIDWREADTPEALKADYHGERDAAIRTRLQALWLLRSGWTLGEVVEAVGVHYRSVQRWAAWYRAGGVPAARARWRGGSGPVPLLTAEAQAQVADAVATGRFRIAGEIRDWIATAYGATYTVGGVYSLLERLRCAPKAPRPVHAKADREQQAAWKKGGSSKRLRLLR